FLICMASWLACGFAWAQGTPDWQAETEALGRTGKLVGEVYKINFPRTDLDVRVGETKVEAAAGLNSWIAFHPVGGDVAILGDLVLLAHEVDSVVSALESRGIQITAIHNHLSGEQPVVVFVHFWARGRGQDLARAVRLALLATGTPTEAPAPISEILPFDRAPIETALGKPGEAKGRVLAFSFPRQHSIAVQGMELPPAMGMATALNFQPSPRGVAATGDFVLREGEVQGVIAALRSGGATVTAVHNHLLQEEPRAVFVHFWAEGAASAVARTLRAALDTFQKQASARR
ncbi:MAG: DUF1259 domain-containing protein, partial [Terriglobales bacterium]